MFEKTKKSEHVRNTQPQPIQTQIGKAELVIDETFPSMCEKLFGQIFRLAEVQKSNLDNSERFGSNLQESALVSKTINHHGDNP